MHDENLDSLGFLATACFRYYFQNKGKKFKMSLHGSYAWVYVQSFQPRHFHLNSKIFMWGHDFIYRQMQLYWAQDVFEETHV